MSNEAQVVVDQPHLVLLPQATAAAAVEWLRHEFPQVRFVMLSADGEVPRDARHAKVLFRSIMSMAALEKAVSQLPALEWIQTSTAGFNWVMVPEVAARQIRLTRTANVLNRPIAEHVLTLTLALLKQLPELFRAQQRAEWIRPAIRPLYGATVGIIGAGAIGREAAVRFRAFGARVIGTKRKPTPLPEFDEVLGSEATRELLSTVDVLVIACPLTSETRHLIGIEELKLMKPNAVLVNVARGEVVVEADLVAALRSGLIAGAALDVFATEPLPGHSPFWDLPNVIVSPHASFIAPGNEAGVLAEFVENLKRYLNGRDLLNEIGSRELGY